MMNSGAPMRYLLMVFLCLMFVSTGQQTPPRPGDDSDAKLPDGRSQKNAIAKDDYQHSLDDARELVKIAQSIEEELEKNDQYVVSLGTIRKTEDIEKLAKRIRGRFKRY